MRSIKTTSFPDEVATVLKNYVYLYIDPRSNEVFYIGRGVGDRAFAHLEEKDESPKVARILELNEAGIEPRIDILRHGLTVNEAALVEAAAIDLIGTAQLTNKVRGFHSSSFGRISTDDLIAVHSAVEAGITHKVLLITINQLYHSNMSAQELYEVTRGVWILGERRNRVEYAFAVFRGVVREVYRIHAWHPAGTTTYETRDAGELRDDDRWEFDGEIAADVRDQYVGKSVRGYFGKSNQNPARYVNVPA